MRTARWAPMRPGIVRAVVTREVREMTRNRVLLAAVAIPPVVLIALPILVAQVEPAKSLPPATAAHLLATQPAWRSLTPGQLAAAFSLQQMITFFLLMPATIPLAIAAYSIVGEKQSRSLEAVIASPIRTSELLAGKVLASVVPGVATVWLGYAILVALAGVLMGPGLARVITDATWIAAVFALGPAIGLVSVVVGVVISSRVGDPRAAQQLGTVLVLPAIAFAVLQAQNGTLFGAADYLRAAAVVAALGFAGLRLGIRLFGRESILLRWK